jgi:hypothetical protein
LSPVGAETLPSRGLGIQQSIPRNQAQGAPPRESTGSGNGDRHSGFRLKVGCLHECLPAHVSTELNRYRTFVCAAFLPSDSTVSTVMPPTRTSSRLKTAVDACLRLDEAVRGVPHLPAELFRSAATMS